MRRRSASVTSDSASDLDTDAGPDELATLLDLTERYCVVYQTLRSGPPVALEIAVTDT